MGGVVWSLTSSRLKALCHAALAAGPLRKPPFPLAIAPRTLAMKARPRAAMLGELLSQIPGWNKEKKIPIHIFSTDLKLGTVV